jgi:quercetin dioxygenase-like cupin family protein
MTQTHAVLEMEPLGIRVEVRRTAEETDGELFEMDVIGRPRAFFARRHVHPSQTERLEMISGAIKVTMHGRDHIVNEGESIEIPAGTPHTHPGTTGGTVSGVPRAARAALPRREGNALRIPASAGGGQPHPGLRRRRSRHDPAAFHATRDRSCPARVRRVRASV